MNIELYGSLGDTVAITGTIREFKKQYPNEIVTIKSRYPEVFENNPNFNSGIENNGIRVPIPLAPFDYIGNYVYAYGKWLGIKIYNSEPEIFLTDDEKNKFKNKNVIVIDSWAGWTSRRWHLDNFYKLINLLKQEDPNLIIVECGSKVVDYNGVTRNYYLDNVDIFYDSLSVRDQAALIYSSKLVIGNDSGLGHLAAAVGTKQIIIYTVNWYSRAYKTTYPVFSMNRDCSQYEHGCTEVCPFEISCINKDVTPQDIIQVYRSIKF